MTDTLRPIPMARFTEETRKRLQEIRDRVASGYARHLHRCKEDATFLLNLVGESAHTLAASTERLEAVKAELAAIKECPPSLLALKPESPSDAPGRREVARVSPLWHRVQVGARCGIVCNEQVSPPPGLYPEYFVAMDDSEDVAGPFRDNQFAILQRVTAPDKIEGARRKWGRHRREVIAREIAGKYATGAEYAPLPAGGAFTQHGPRYRLPEWVMTSSTEAVNRKGEKIVQGADGLWRFLFADKVLQDNGTVDEEIAVNPKPMDPQPTLGKPASPARTKMELAGLHFGSLIACAGRIGILVRLIKKDDRPTGVRIRLADGSLKRLSISEAKQNRVIVPGKPDAVCQSCLRQCADALEGAWVDLCNDCMGLARSARAAIAGADLIHFLRNGRLGCRPGDNPKGAARTPIAERVSCAECKRHLPEWVKEQEAAVERIAELVIGDLPRIRAESALAMLKSIRDGGAVTREELLGPMFRLGLVQLVPDGPPPGIGQLGSTKLVLSDLGRAVLSGAVNLAGPSLLAMAWREWLDTGKAPNLYICGRPEPEWSKRAAELLAEPRLIEGLTFNFSREQVAAATAQVRTCSSMGGAPAEATDEVICDCHDPSCGCADCQQKTDGPDGPEVAPDCVCPQGHNGVHDPGCLWKQWKDGRG